MIRRESYSKYRMCYFTVKPAVEKKNQSMIHMRMIYQPEASVKMQRVKKGCVKMLNDRDKCHLILCKLFTSSVYGWCSG